jgi:hypothetical protein
MRTVTTDSTLLLHTRADDGGDIIGTGYGMAVPYGVEIEFDGMRESFAPGAFDTPPSSASRSHTGITSPSASSRQPPTRQTASTSTSTS